MVQRTMRRSLIFVAGILVATALPSAAQQPDAGTKVVQVTGFVGVKANAKGSLTPVNGNLQFENSKAKVSVPIHSVEDVITGNDSQRVFRERSGH